MKKFWDFFVKKDESYNFLDKLQLILNGLYLVSIFYMNGVGY